MTEVQYVAIGRIRPYWNNPRVIEDVSGVAASIERFGFRNPIIVDKDLVIIAGHARLMAASMMKMAEVPVIIAKDLTPEQCRAYRLADNKTGELATWDDERLREEMMALAETDLGAFGFEEPEVEGGDGMALDAEDFGTDFELPDIDEGPALHTMTFVLSEAQADIVRSALGRAGGAVGNDKGGQLTEVCNRWLEQRTAS